MVSGQVTNSDDVTVTYGEGETVTAETVVVSVGRRPMSETLGLAGSEVEVDDRGFVVTDPFCRTTAPNVWAVGDLTQGAALAHIAFAEGNGGYQGHSW